MSFGSSYCRRLSSASSSPSSSKANDAVDDGRLATSADLLCLLEATLPLENVVYAFGYGSGVLSQQQRITKTAKDNGTNMIDMMVVVNDSHKFHQANLRRNPQHYSTSPFSPFSFFFQNDQAAKATWLQRHDLLYDNSWFTNPKVYFVVSAEQGIKYGVIQVDDLSSDLVDWNYLYVAGRLHKPTVEILNSYDKIKEQQTQYNLPAALSASLLLLSNNNNNNTNDASAAAKVLVEEQEVYARIASLSYTGDFRMAVGAEDPFKILKLVKSPGQLGRFRALYEEAAERLQREGILSITTTIPTTTTRTTSTCNNTVWSWDTSPAARAHFWSRLPKSLQQNEASSSSLQQSLVSIVAPAARYQSLKGLMTAGSWRTSARYAARKLSKGLFKK